ncbi:MAG: YHYH protein [Saprospiraceae bacterium]
MKMSGLIILFWSILVLQACTKEKLSELVQNNFTPTTSSAECTDVMTLDDSRGPCTETLGWENQVSISISGQNRIITSNGIPAHLVGLFGNQPGALNPNAIKPQQTVYQVTTTPAKSGHLTWLFDPASGPRYTFGVMLNGIQMDPEAAEPWPHTRPINFNRVNWAWNLDAMSVNLGLDCNNAHVQPTGKYHYHGAPVLYLQGLNATGQKMILVGYAADGFPVYYKYGFTSASNNQSGLTELRPSYRLKSGDRPGDGNSAPCGSYSGIYTADYEFVEGLGDLDECNGRTGVTPEYPDGTYYYLITDTYPYIGRCLVGTPSNDFKLR